MKTISKVRLVTTTCLTMAAALISGTAQAQDALPSGGSVVQGNATITVPSNGRQTITQTSDRAVINWQSFDVGQANSVIFAQPNSSAATLNRVTGNTASTIAGQITANGQVYLINPNGIQITSTGTVNAGRGFVASTLDISDTDFMAGTGIFTGDGGLIDHQGSITVGTGGTIGLLGGNVRSTGLIAAPAGKVVIGAVARATLDLNGDGFLQVALPDSAAVTQSGSAALVSAQDAYLAARNVVNLEGVSASSVSGHNGQITLGGTVNVDSISGNAGSIMVMGDATTVNATLTARARGSNGDGGFIETSGNHVSLDGISVDTSAANGKTGTWLIDPVDFTVAASGGDLTGAALSAQLANNNVVIKSINGATMGSGDININDAVSWTSDSRLTLTAERNINVNQNITASGANAALLLRADANGTGTGTVIFNSGITANLSGANSQIDIYYNPTRYSAPTDFSASVAAGTRNYWMLVNSLLNLQSINSSLDGYYALSKDIDASTSASWGGGAGFAPIGSFGYPFTGRFDGMGHVIRGLPINRSSQDYIGLFSVVSEGSLIENLGLEGVSIVGHNNTGSLVGYLNGGDIRNVYTTGNVNGGQVVGGLIGSATGGTINNAYTSANVQGTGNDVGGLAGYVFQSTISDVYATGNVFGPRDNVGGLLGSSAATISNAYATGAVSGGTGNTNGSQFVGGLIGRAYGNSHTNTFYNLTTTGQTTGAGGRSDVAREIEGLTTAQLAGQLPAGFDTAIWGNGRNQTTPYLLAFDWAPTAGTVILGKDSSSTPIYYHAITNANQLQAINRNLSGNYVLGNNIDASTTATWNNGAGFVSLGTNGASSVLNGGNGFTGKLDGLGHTISDLTIFRPSASNTGLFGFNSGAITNVGLVNARVRGNAYTGALIGDNRGNVFLTYAAGTVIGADATGGLVGTNATTGLITYSYATATTSGNNYVGGLVGGNNGIITHSYATGRVSGASVIGGLAGQNYNIIVQSYWDSYSSGQGTGIGRDNGTAMNVNAVTSDPNQRSASNYAFNPAAWANWVSDIDTTGGQPLTWRMYAGATTPLLKVFLTQARVGTISDTVIYDGTNHNTSAGYTLDTGVDSALILGTLNGASGTNAGTYVIGIDGLFSSQQGYDLVAGTLGTLTIDRKALTVIGQTASNKIYDATTAAVLSGGSLSGVVASDLANVSLISGTGSFADKNAETGKAVTVTGTTLSGTAASNYTVNDPTGLTANIDRANLTVSGVSALDKTYDGTTTATLAGNAIVAGLGSDDVAVLANSGNGDFIDANAGMGKAVIVTGFALTGQDAGNYTVSNPTGLTANIERKALTVVGQTASNKIYDTTTTAVLSGGSLSGVVASDLANVSLISGTGNFADKNAGTGKAIIVTGTTLSGTAASNYTVSDPTGLTANIDRRALTVTYTANTASGTYGDVPSNLTGTVSISGLVGNDSLGDVIGGTTRWRTDATGQSDVGTYAITGSGLSDSSGNYILNTAQGAGNSTAYTVTPRAITVMADAQTRLAGTANPPLTYTIGGLGLVNGDSLTGTLITEADLTSAAGSYVIEQGTLATTANYAVTYNSAILTVTATPDVAPSRFVDTEQVVSDHGIGGEDINSVNLTSAFGTAETTVNDGKELSEDIDSPCNLQFERNSTRCSALAE